MPNDPHLDAMPPLEFQTFTLDPIRRTLLASGHPVALPARPFDILLHLIVERHRIVSSQELLAAVWQGRMVASNNLTVQLSILRRALAEHGADDLIITVPGRGYRFVGEVKAPQWYLDDQPETPRPAGVPTPPASIAPASLAPASIAPPPSHQPASPPPASQRPPLPPSPIAAAPADARGSHPGIGQGWGMARQRWVGAIAGAALALVFGFCLALWLQAIGPKASTFAAHVQVETKPDMIVMTPGGYCPVDYIFRVANHTELQLATEDVRFHLLSGEPVSEASVRGRIYHGSFPISGPGIAVYHNTIYLPPQVVAAAVANGSKRVYLRHMFHLSDPSGNEVSAPAVLMIILGSASEACHAVP